MKVGDLVKFRQDVLNTPSDTCLGIVVGSDIDTLWVHPEWAKVFILEGTHKGETFQFEKDQIEVISSAA
tara:strand:- start:12458 stop:12664 length:207 start_codon:yes stop_codon:yes gene_type:complete